MAFLHGDFLLLDTSFDLMGAMVSMTFVILEFTEKLAWAIEGVKI